MGEVAEAIEEHISPMLAAEGVELVDVTFNKGPAGWTLSLLLDKSGGITLKDLEDWNDKIGTKLDDVDLIDRSYVLELASPGVDRPLRKVSDFQRFAGQRVHVRLYAGLNGQKNFHGELLGGDEKEIRLRLEDDNREIRLPREQVAKCRLDPVIKI